MIAVIKMVTGIKNSVQALEIFTNSKVLNANVIEWPIVKAVMSISNFFQSLHK